MNFKPQWEQPIGYKAMSPKLPLYLLCLHYTPIFSYIYSKYTMSDQTGSYTNTNCGYVANKQDFQGSKTDGDSVSLGCFGVIDNSNPETDCVG